MCLGFVMIDLDGVIEEDWLALSQDNHDTFNRWDRDRLGVCLSAGIRDIRKHLTLSLGNVSFALISSLLLFVSLGCRFLLSFSISLSPPSSDPSVFASHLSSSSHPACRHVLQSALAFLCPSASGAIPQICQMNN